MKKVLILSVMTVFLLCLGFAFAIHDASAAIASEPQAGALTVPVDLKGTLKGTDAIQSSTEPSEQQGITSQIPTFISSTGHEGMTTAMTSSATIPESKMEAAAETLTGQNILYAEYTEPSTMMIGTTADGGTFGTTYVETASPPITIAMAETPGEHRTSVTSYAAVFLIDYTYVAYTKSFPAIGPC